MSDYPQDLKDIYLASWQDSVDAINDADASETEIIQANKDHLTMLKSFTWFTDAITAEELATINAVLA